MSSIISLDEVNAVRRRIANAHALAAERFRAVAAGNVLAAENWRTHLEIQAAALVHASDGVTLRGGISYELDSGFLAPHLSLGEPLHRYFDVRRTPVAILEYWVIYSEISSAAAWNLTQLVVTSTEFDAVLRVIQKPNMVRALAIHFLPAVDIRPDGSATLEVTVYTRAGEERIERRLLSVDGQNQITFHSRELLVEGRGGVEV